MQKLKCLLDAPGDIMDNTYACIVPTRRAAVSKDKPTLGAMIIQDPEF
jgi:hypothetical protein